MTDLVLPLNTIVQGHTLDILRRLPPNLVQCCIAHLVEIFRVVRRAF